MGENIQGSAEIQYFVIFFNINKLHQRNETALFCIPKFDAQLQEYRHDHAMRIATVILSSCIMMDPY